MERGPQVRVSLTEEAGDVRQHQSGEPTIRSLPGLEEGVYPIGMPPTLLVKCKFNGVTHSRKMSQFPIDLYCKDSTWSPRPDTLECLDRIMAEE